MTMTSGTPQGVAMGSITGLAAGTIVSAILLARSRHFCVAEGSPLENDSAASREGCGATLSDAGIVAARQ